MAQWKKIDNNLLNAILFLVAGLLFCILRADALSWLLTIVGVLFVVQGVLCLTRKDTNGGIIGLAIGLLLILGGWLFVQFVMIVFGVLVIVKGIMDLLNVLKMKTKPVMPLVMAILTLVIGVLLIVSQNLLLDWFFILLGIVFIANGVLALLGKRL